MASGDFNHLVLRKTTAYNSDGSYIKDGYVFTVSSNGKQNWTPDLRLNNLVLSTFTLSSQLYVASSLFDRASISTLAVSSLTASSITAGNMVTTDIITCTMNASTFFFPSVSLQSIYASSMNNNSFTTNDATASTLRVTNLSATNFSFLTLTGNILVGDTVTTSTVVMKNGSYSTLIGSTLSANTAVLQSTLLASTMNAVNIGYSTLIGNTISANTITVQSTLVGSTVNAVSIGYSIMAGSTLTMNTGVWNSTLTGSTLLCSTVNATSVTYSILSGSALNTNTIVLNSTLIGSTVQAVNVGYSTLAGSTMTSNDATVQTILTASTITAVNIGCSTLSANSVVIPSTLVVSSVLGSTMVVSTLGVAAITSGSIGFSTLAGSTISAPVMTVSSTLYASSLTAMNIGYSTLQGDAIESRSINASIVTGSTINFANLLFSTVTASTVTANVMFPLSLQGSTVNVSSLLTASYVGIGTTVVNYPLTVSQTALGAVELNRTSTVTNNFYAAGTVYTVTDPANNQFKGTYAYAFGGAKTLATASQSQAAGYYAIDVANAGLFGSDTVGAAMGATFYMDSVKTYFQNTVLGIGTTSPGWPLTVAKDMSFAAMTSNPLDATLVIKGQSNTGTLKMGTYFTGTSFGAAIQSSQFSTGVDDPSALILNPLGGNVGVGTTNPSTALHVIGGVTASGSISSGGTVNSVGQFNMSDALIAANGIVRITTTAGVNSIQSGLTSASDSKADLVFGSMLVGTEWMRIKSTGNVGIGTNNPSNLLSIFSGSSNAVALSLTSSGSGLGSGIQFINTAAPAGRTYGVYSGSDGSFYVSDVTGGVNRITISPSGDITLGSVRSFTFTVVVSGSGYNQVIGNTRTGNPLYVTSGVWAISVNATTITTTPVDLNPISANAYVATNIDVPTYARVYSVVSTSANMTITGGASGGATTGYGIFLNITNPAAYGTYTVNFLRVN